MKTIKRRLFLVAAGAVLAAAALPGAALATDLNVCTWLTQQVGDAVGTSAAPGAVLGPNNGGLPGGDKGPFPISFTSDEELLQSLSSVGPCP